MPDTMYIQFGANVAAIHWATIAGGILAVCATAGAAGPFIAGGIAATGVGLEIAKSEFNKQLLKEGYSAVQPGGVYKSEKLTLSLLMQANIVLVGKGGVRRGTLECWTGPTDDSCNEYRASQAGFEFVPF